jgi:signal recognition particle receptor subunit beta
MLARTQPFTASLSVMTKVVVAGPFGVGKTSFVGAASEIEPLRTEARMQVGPDPRAGSAAETTVALDFGRVTLPSNLVVYLYGTPGHERFRFMWDILSQGMLGFVLLVDPEPGRLTEAQLDLSVFRALGTPYVVGMNRRHAAHGDDEPRVRSELGVDDAVPVVGCDARDRKSVTGVLIAFLEHAIRSLRAPRASNDV